MKSYNAAMCWKCDTAFLESERRSFRAVCASCGKDLHVCLNCSLYLPGAHHDCRESQTEFVKEKDRSNLCEYFIPAVFPRAGKRSGGASSASGDASASGKARDDFNKLFG